MQERTREEILRILCAPESIDEPEESDFEEYDTVEEEMFVENWIKKELN
jgi:hypothetical protein